MGLKFTTVTLLVSNCFTGLESHVKGIHSKKKSFECQQCQKKFKFATNLSRHLKAQHDEVRLKFANYIFVVSHDFMKLRELFKIFQNNLLEAC